MCVSLRSWCVCAAVLLFIAQEARAQNGKLVWDHADSGAVTLGYSVTIDGITTDYGVSPIGAGPGGSRGCAIPLPFSGGYHIISVTAYNLFGKTQSAVFPVGPVAEAGAPYSSQAGQPVTLDGGGSVSPNGWITEYSWHWGDGTGQTSSPSPTASHVFDGPGTFNVVLMITDNAGARASSTVVVTIAEP
jgi:PKD domain